MPVLHVPITEIPNRFYEIPKDMLVVIFCLSGVRLSILYTYLRIKGFGNVRLLVGKYD